jgi:hypothetical protein
VLFFQRGNHQGNDAINGLVQHELIYPTKDLQKANPLDDTEAIIVVAMEYVGTHKCEHGHDVVQNRLWGNAGETGDE